MRLDVVVPSYNRSGLMRKTVESLLRAPVPAGLDVSIVVVDNNSPDDTAAVVQQLQAAAALPVHYLCEYKQGSSHARNAGILASSADLIGFVDDDEEVDPTWFEVVAREFADPEVQFIGGPYLPNWITPAPDWLPPGYPAVIGVIPPKPRSLYGKAFGANLMGGNAVLRREVFTALGLYDPHLGRSNKGLLSEEDADFYRRLEKAGVRGIYVPDLVIYHYIAPDRLTRQYHRRWVLWRAVSQGMLDRQTPEPAAYLAGVPRYRFGKALRSLALLPWHLLRSGNKAHAFADELALWDLAGFLHGKHFFRAEAYYTEAASAHGASPAPSATTGNGAQ